MSSQAAEREVQGRRGNRSIRMVVLFVPTGPASEADSAAPRSLIARHQAGVTWTGVVRGWFSATFPDSCPACRAAALTIANQSTPAYLQIPSAVAPDYR